MTSIADQFARPQVSGPSEDAALHDAAAAKAPAISLPAIGERELRLDLFRGLALWLFFIDHLPPSLLTWFTIRNSGFSDATELFTFFLAEISYVAFSFDNPLYSEEMGIMDFLKHPDVTIVQALLLRFRPVN